jgi:putative long chain acyl-CoA synthase
MKTGFDWRRALDNAFKIATRRGVAAPYQHPFAVAMQDRRVALRRYGDGRGRPLLLVPPLMVTSAIYDISPDLSAVGYLTAQGADVWLADFGAPEAQAGGLERTLDDHVLGVSDCIEHIVRATGEDVHLIGYSQGGMFAYQAAAYRFGRFGRGRGRPGLASITAFGAPVDIRRNLPVQFHDTLAERLIASLRRLIDRPLAALEALPGTMSAAGFKLLAPIAELRQLVTVLGRLDDEEALARILPKRRFLGGEGFIAWPGPALRKFIDEFVVGNRMKLGGFVIEGRSVSLADIECPILCVLGTADDLAQPESVRGIVEVAERSEVRVLELAAGHFGLVVGSLAMQVSWPTVLAFCRWLDEGALDGLDPIAAASGAPKTLQSRGFGDSAERVWDALGGVSVRVVSAWDKTRWRLPRLGRLLGMTPESRVSLSRLLSRRARAIPDEVCFLWRGRAFTYADANRRVDGLALALYSWGVRPGDRVGVAIADHPDLFSVVLALGRLGAVAVVGGLAERTVCDAAHRPEDGAFALVGDGEAEVRLDDLAARLEPEDLPGFTALRPNPGRADEDALVLAVDVRLTHGAWFTRAVEEAVDHLLRPGDTALVLPPFSDARSLIHALGGALVGGARLALASSEEAFDAQAARVGATHVFADAPDAALSARGLRVIVIR